MTIYQSFPKYTHSEQIEIYQKIQKYSRNAAITLLVISAISTVTVAAAHGHSAGLHHFLQEVAVYAFGGAAGLFIICTIFAFLKNRSDAKKIPFYGFCEIK